MPRKKVEQAADEKVKIQELKEPVQPADASEESNSETVFSEGTVQSSETENAVTESETEEAEKELIAREDASKAETDYVDRENKEYLPLEEEIPIKENGYEDLTELYAARFSKGATDEQKKELYHSDEQIHTGWGIDTSQLPPTRAQEVKGEYMKLAQAANSRNPQVLEGRLVGATTSQAANEEPMAQVKFESGYFDIRIPVRFLFDFDLQILDTPDGAKRLMREIQMRIGSAVHFIVFQVDEGSRKAYASRMHAMSKEGLKNFVDIPRGEEKPALIAGMIVPAKVVCIHRNNVVVDVCGVESIIPREELSWLPLRELEEEFSRGQAFYVRILSIGTYLSTVNLFSDGSRQDKAHNIRMVKLTVSKRQAEKDPREEYLQTLEPGATYEAEVKYSTERSVHVVIRGKIDATCRIPPFRAGKSNELPVNGQHCIVSIKAVDMEKKTVRAEIIYYERIR